MENNYRLGNRHALSRLGLVKTAGGWGDAFKRFFSRGARRVSTAATRAADHVDPPPSGLVDPYGRPVSSRASAETRLPPSPAEASPSLVRRAMQNRGRAYTALNAYNGYNSNSHEDTPTAQRFIDGAVGGLTTATLGKIPLPLSKELGYMAGVAAVPVARQLRK